MKAGGTGSPGRGKGTPPKRNAGGTPTTPNKARTAGGDKNSPSPSSQSASSGLRRSQQGSDKPKSNTPQKPFRRFAKEQSRKKISLRRSESQETSFHATEGGELTDFGEVVRYNQERGSLEFRLDGLQLVDTDIERFVAWLRPNLDQIRLWHQEQISQFGKKTKAGKPKQKAVANLYLQENRITDTGIKTLFDYITSLPAHSLDDETSAKDESGEAPIKALTFRRFFLFKNFISDEGASRVAEFIRQSKAPIFEIHLSHNRISTEGALSIFRAVKDSKLYPTRGACNPLWLRLEYNYISTTASLEELKTLGMPYCPAVDRRVCSSGKCCFVSDKDSGIKPYLHLYVFDMQYKMVEQSVRLQSAKMSAELARRQRKTPSKSTPSAKELAKPKNLPETTKVSVDDLQEKEAEPRETEKRSDITISDKDVALPTYLFLDTNAVIWMVSGLPADIGAAGNEKMKGNGGRGEKKKDYGKEESKAGGWSGKIFSFQNLVAKAKRKQFGECFESEADRVCLVITDTVMQELDHLKFSNPKLARKIAKQVQSDTGYLAQCSQLHFLEMLGAHQGEHLVALTAGQIVAGPSDVGLLASPSSLRNDRRIIDVALLWNSEIGVTGSVIFITNDRGAMETAKRHNLPAVCVDEIDKNLKFVSPEMPWTASVIKSCMPQATTYGGKVISATPIKPIRSVYSEIEASIALVEKLAKRIQSLEEKHHEENEGGGANLLAEAAEHIERWKSLLESQQVGPYSSQKKKGLVASNSNSDGVSGGVESVRVNLLEKFEELADGSPKKDNNETPQKEGNQTTTPKKKKKKRSKKSKKPNSSPLVLRTTDSPIVINSSTTQSEGGKEANNKENNEENKQADLIVTKAEVTAPENKEAEEKGQQQSEQGKAMEAQPAESVEEVDQKESSKEKEESNTADGKKEEEEVVQDKKEEKKVLEGTEEKKEEKKD